MRIGLDFDNTIVCYDAVIEELADELFDLPPEVPRTKLGLREFLRSEGREHEWTAFQGELYGPGMRQAQPFEGAIETMLHLVEQGYELVIVSHRSLRPYAGEPHDLHAAAHGWVEDRLQSVGLFTTKNVAAVNFLETFDQKIAMIGHQSCKAFVDDLPEVLTDTGFPSSTIQILFNPFENSKRRINERNLAISAWHQLPPLLISI
jgi:hypothetical protein